MNNKVKIVLGVFLIVIEITRPGMGFYYGQGMEGIGYNFATIMFYYIGATLTVSGFNGLTNNKDI